MTIGAPTESETRIGVFAEAPLPGRCLSNLLTAHAPEWVSGLYAAMLRDTLDGLQSIDAREYIVFAPADDEATSALARHVPAPWQIVAGVGDVSAAMARLRGESGLALLARSHAPSAAIEPLVDLASSPGDASFAVLGPAEEGDAWLVGIARTDPLLVRALPWASPELAATIRVRCNRAALTLHELPAATVVDAPSAVLALLDELRRFPERAPRTAHYVVTRG